MSLGTKTLMYGIRRIMKLFRIMGSGGEGGIRTHGRGSCPDNRLAGGPNQPLWHLPINFQGGGRGIRTPGGLYTHSCFQDNRLSPLGHPSNVLIVGSFSVQAEWILPQVSSRCNEALHLRNVFMLEMTSIKMI